jgi:hypothetical protein
MRLAAGVLMGMLVEAAAAQVGQPVRVDPGHGDTSPNAISLKRMDLDLRQPSGFQHVYQISSIDAFGAKQTTFMRMDGAVTAVFPRSVYLPTAAGLLPDIPPGTVFHIGPLPEPPRAGTYVSSTFLDLSVKSEQEVLTMPAPAIVGVGSLISDEAYRHRRIEALMAFAMER